MKKDPLRQPSALRDLSPGVAASLAEVLRGLRQPAKELPCKFFYDERGSRLFEQICDLDEYYLTRTELAIMRRHVPAMAARLGPRCLLIEYGSGSSIKTRLLLDHLLDPAGYVPMDISREHLTRSAHALASAYPAVPVLPVCADFTGPLELPPIDRPVARRVVYFPGSTIGNFTPAETLVLLRRIVRLVGPGGGLLLGTDLQKDPHVLEAAYNDSKGVTAAFNLNVLRRLNRELGADFRLDHFRHRALYDSEAGRIEMHLVSLEDQVVRIADERISFRAGESIRTEYSYKYTLDGLRALAARAELAVADVWTDPERLFSVQYLTAEGVGLP